MNASDVAKTSNLPEPTVAKVLKLLTKADVLSSVRGASGGYHLARPIENITIADVICAIDGPIALTSCVEAVDESCCDYAQCCPMNGRWNKVNAAIKTALDGVSLADMTEGCMAEMKERA